jgi:hypothetical protein
VSPRGVDAESMASVTDGELIALHFAHSAPQVEHMNTLAASGHVVRRPPHRRPSADEVGVVFGTQWATQRPARRSYDSTGAAVAARMRR